MKFLFPIAIILPFLGSLFSIFLKDKKPNIERFFIVGINVLFIVIILGLWRNLGHNVLNIFLLNKNISLSLVLDADNFRELIISCFLMTILTFYSIKINLIESHRHSNFLLYCGILFGLVNLAIFSANIFSLFFCFYLAQITFLKLFISDIYKTIKVNLKDHKGYFTIFKNKNFKVTIFKIIFLSEVLLFFLATTLVINFSQDPQISQFGVDLSSSKIITILIINIFILSIFLSILLPTYFLFKNDINDSAITNILAFVVFFVFFKFLVFIKIIKSIISIGLFSAVFPKLILNLIILILAIEMMISLGMILFTKDIKKIGIQLFFNQLFFLAINILFMFFYDEENFPKILESFVLSIILFFITFSSLLVYLRGSSNKDIAGLFFDMRISISLIIFSLINICGLAPGYHMLIIFNLIKFYLSKKLYFILIIVLINILGIVLFTSKLTWVMISKQENKRDQHDIDLAKKIDNSISITFPSFLTALVIIVAGFVTIFI